MASPTSEILDVLVVGAGLSGIGAAYHLQTLCPGKSFAIVEARDTLGGTWDLFRYPGIRSDSDMYTLGFSFKPWRGEKAIADGPSILAYLEETARENGIDRKIRYGHRVTRASWSSDASMWTVDMKKNDGTTTSIRCRFLFLCSGYYDYAKGYTPDFPGVERYRGRVVHPQFWTGDIDYADKRVVVIGSGATAVTLVPELAKKAKHVTMLQRSPTYVISLPAVDPVTKLLEEKAPSIAYPVTRWKNITVAIAMFNFCKKYPERAKRFLVGNVKKALGPGVDVKKHFTPSYGPWDQRLCFVPDGDLFDAIKDGRAEVVTDHIETFDETGIQLKSGAHLDADLVVTATGLKLQLLGGAELEVDGKKIEGGKTTGYKGIMLGDVPNMAFAVGYTNASWTLKADLASGYVCRLLNHMDKKGYRVCVPRLPPGGEGVEPMLNLSSGYVKRAEADLPKQGARAPWRLYQNYIFDLVGLRYGKVEDGVLDLRT
ncbi:MAG: NAD(P)/FAD-dependent oxidoreductase [Deltaproteobacteria bacterium]|nr:NAD(P)/FAD-dependent oxidoreductase [Deltaproteobacteria bacterium]